MGEMSVVIDSRFSRGCVGNIPLPWLHYMVSSPEGNTCNWDLAFVQWEVVSVQLVALTANMNSITLF